MNSAGVVLAFHGCDAVTRDAILTGELPGLSRSNNPYDWLGPGVYFFEGDPQRALNFAVAAAAQPERKYTKRPIASPAVLGAILRVGNWLDMSTQSGVAEYTRALESLRKIRTKIPINKAAFVGDNDLILRNLDRAVFKHIHESRGGSGQPAYDAVRSPFAQGKPLADDCRFTESAHVQIAVYDMKAVVGWFLPIGDRLMREPELSERKAVLQALSPASGSTTFSAS